MPRYAKDSYNWVGCLGNPSPSLTKIKAQETSVGLPKISEFIKFPIRIKNPARAVGTAILSSIQTIGFFDTFLEKSQRPIKMPNAPPWLAKPPCQV